MKRSRVLVLGLLLFVASCVSLPGGPYEEERERLQWNRERWRAHGVDSYEYEFRRVCFCPPNQVGPVRVRVERGRVVAVIRVETGEPVPENELRHFPPVEGLFDAVEDAVRREVGALEVTYDPEYGYPTRIWIDVMPDAVDDGVLYIASRFRPGS